MPEAPLVPGISQRRADEFLVFRLGAASFAVDLDAVQELTLMARLSNPPGLPSLLAGFLNLGQQAVPIIRLDRLLELAESEHGLYTQILILRGSSGTPVGWAVDRVTHILSVAQTELVPVPDRQCFKDCTKGMFALEEADVTILVPSRILLEQERQSVNEFQQIEQARLRELGNAAA